MKQMEEYCMRVFYVAHIIPYAEIKWSNNRIILMPGMDQR